MDYKKQIYYLDYYEKGIKEKALGHIVWLERQGKCEFDVSISKLERLFLGQASVLLLYENNTETIGILDIKNGHGEKNFYVGQLKEKPIGIRISMTPEKWLEKIWEKRTEEIVEQSTDTKMAKNILEDYHICHPFGNDEEYYSVEADILQRLPEIKKLENNSFLLHGYYNYRHLILKNGPNGTITIGVPGVYYEREKKVAAMYGFDNFKGVKNLNNIGCFGYYMRKI